MSTSTRWGAHSVNLSLGVSVLMSTSKLCCAMNISMSLRYACTYGQSESVWICGPRPWGQVYWRTECGEELGSCSLAAHSCPTGLLRGEGLAPASPDLHHGWRGSTSRQGLTGCPGPLTNPRGEWEAWSLHTLPSKSSSLPSSVSSHPKPLSLSFPLSIPSLNSNTLLSLLIHSPHWWKWSFRNANLITSLPQLLKTP